MSYKTQMAGDLDRRWSGGRERWNEVTYLVVLVVVRLQVLRRVLHRDATLVREVAVAVVHVG